MYGLSDKCPASVDKLSAFLELISSLEHYPGTSYY